MCFLLIGVASYDVLSQENRDDDRYHTQQNKGGASPQLIDPGPKPTRDWRWLRKS